LNKKTCLPSIFFEITGKSMSNPSSNQPTPQESTQKLIEELKKRVAEEIAKPKG
jgi:hypothetical protein